ALLPIGAYEPKEIMQDNHMNPQEALKAAQILDAKEMIPYHYATFKLTEEPIGEPHIWMKELSLESKIDISILDIGEIHPLMLIGK
ncbi:MAG: metal-dependent hydrolase, partial [Sulfurovum sp.]